MLEEFLYENFVQPLCKYYTPFETLTYGIILSLSTLLIYRFLKKMKIKINKDFFISLLPFIIYGGWTRALRDHNLGIYKSILWCSPPIYVIIFFIAISSLLLSIYLDKKYKLKYKKTMLAIGSILLLYNLYLTRISNPYAMGIVLSIFTLLTLILVGLHKVLPKYMSFTNSLILSSHMLDASASFTAISFFGYYEQHVLPGFLISIFGPWIMFPLKLIIVYIVLAIIDKYSEDEFFRNFLKIIVLILGLALGIRDTLTISM